MKRTLVLDPRYGTLNGQVLALSGEGEVERVIPLQYVPELRYSVGSGELVLLETDVSGDTSQDYLAVWDAESLEETLRRPIHRRPMYTGYPGRSIAGQISGSGRYVYFVRSGPIVEAPDGNLAFRLIPCRYDRESDRFEQAKIAIDSCRLDFGVACNDDNTGDVYFHLACEYPSTIALTSFASPGLEFLHFKKLSSRVYDGGETNGSWLDAARQIVYAINRIGEIFACDLKSHSVRQVCRLQLRAGEAISIHQLHGAGDILYTGIASRSGEQGIAAVSEICPVHAESGAVLQRLKLPMTVMNFAVSSDGAALVCVSPWERSVAAIDTKGGRLLWQAEGVGGTPAEVVIAGTPFAC